MTSLANPLEILRWVKARLHFEWQLRKAPPVLVYQMGKVGSSSVYASLRRLYPGAVLHTHTFSATDRDRNVRRVYRWAMIEKRPIRVISLTRRPIERNVSCFFQNFESETGVPFSKSPYSVEQLKAIFLQGKVHHWAPLDWFDGQIRGVFGIDVYARAFPESGIAEYAKENVRLLVMRAEADDEDKAEALRRFCGLREFALVNTNVGEAKEYAKIYRAFKREVRLPADYIRMMCESKDFNHFYSPETVAASRARWSEETAGPIVNQPTAAAEPVHQNV